MASAALTLNLICLSMVEMNTLSSKGHFLTKLYTATLRYQVVFCNWTPPYRRSDLKFSQVIQAQYSKKPKLLHFTRGLPFPIQSKCHNLFCVNCERGVP
ncbi:unnamed protein product [Lathyrus oleraceus]